MEVVMKTRTVVILFAVVILLGIAAQLAGA